MLIVIAGIKRSGSTALYNMVRLICEEISKDVHIYGDQYDLSNIKKGITIVKIHKFNEELFNKADYIFTSDRPDNDIIRSMILFGTTSRGGISQMRKDLNKWKQKTDGHFHFDLIKNKPKLVINSLIHKFGIGMSTEKIYKQFKEVKPEQEYNPKTFLFPNHISE